MNVVRCYWIDFGIVGHRDGLGARRKSIAGTGRCWGREWYRMKKYFAENYISDRFFFRSSVFVKFLIHEGFSP